MYIICIFMYINIKLVNTIRTKEDKNNQPRYT